MLAIMPISSYAVLQSNPSTHYVGSYRKKHYQWMSEIRQMEGANNAMGLTEKFNSDLTTKDGTESNNIDVHMMRSTEYGAIAILSVSGYGNPDTIEASSLKTTTGNVTGVYYTKSKSEGVAGGLSGRIFGGTNTRYYDNYSSEKGTVKVGDAMNLAWQGSYYSQGWVSLENPYFIRNYEGGYFAYTSAATTIYDEYYSRGVAVCGAGL